VTLEELAGFQARSTWCGFAVPLRPIVTVAFVDELLEIVNWPVAVPTVVGLNVSVRLSVWPGLSLAGKVTEDLENPVPVSEMELMVSAAVPLEVRVTVWVVELFTTTAPKEIVLALTVSAGEAAFS
jgi:hypothetical protein